MSPKSALSSYFIQNGVAEYDAEACAEKIVNWAVTGGGAAAAIGIATANPAALLMAAYGAAGAGGLAYLGSNSCAPVREQVTRILFSSAL